MLGERAIDGWVFVFLQQLQNWKHRADGPLLSPAALELVIVSTPGLKASIEQSAEHQPLLKRPSNWCFF